MSLETILQLISEQHPMEDSSVIINSHALLKKELEAFSYNDRKNFYAGALAEAEKAAGENACPEFVAAALLFAVASKQPTIIRTAQRALPVGVGQIVESHELVHRHLHAANSPQAYQEAYQTALRLAEISSDATTIAAGFLHNLHAHTAVQSGDIRKQLGNEIGDLIDKYRVISEMKGVSINSKHVSALREMVLAMAQDIRVIIIKMCRNINILKNELRQPEELRLIADESMEVLAPIADLLGIWRLRWKLEDYSFKIIQPADYELIAQRFNVDEKKNRDKYIQKTKNILTIALDKAGIEYQISGRFKHFFSIYNKMRNQNKHFQDICDVFALRIIVNSSEDCYRVLGIVHSLWRPKPRRVKDYIADPKNNMYQSLHTSVFGLNGKITEFQIRTKEMDQAAKYGVAAHYRYKNQNVKNPPWVQELLFRQQQCQDDTDFLSNFSSELLNRKIFVYSPKGDVFSLPHNATPIDFAYSVHSEIGHHCSGALVNELPAPLNTKLQNNDVVEIIVDRRQLGPKSEWLGFVASKIAQKQIELCLYKQDLAHSTRL